ncbi:SusC/RagA family TonB-linked outer membrane protein, partial [Chryseobacterium gleum]
LRVLTAGVLFFTGQAVLAQKKPVDSTKQIEEVVVLGYNNKLVKSQTTSAQTTVLAAQIENRPNISMVSSLQGTAPGMHIAANSGSPGSAKVNVLIRGISSLQGSTDPLYVIDGIPVNSTVFRSLNSEDVESFSVLKDAQATSIYGNRGANGVIVITTKKGRFNNKISVRYSGTTGFTQLQKHKYNIANAKETLTLENQWGVGKGATLTTDEIANYAIDTNWEDYFFRKGFSQSHNIAITAGSQNLSSYTSLGYLDQGGIVPTTDFKRFTLRQNIDGKSSNNKFTYSVGISANYSVRNQLEQETRTDIDGNVLQNPLQGLLTSAPYIDPSLYKNGQQLFNDFGSPSFQIIPYMLMDYLKPGNIPNRYNELKLLANFSSKYKFTDDLSASFTMGSDFTENKRVFARAPWSYLAVSSQASAGAAFGGIETQTVDQDFGFNAVTKVNYNKTFAEKHTIDVGVYSEYIKSHRRFFGFTQSGLDPRTWSVGAGTGYVPWSSATPNLYRPTVSGLQQDAGLFSYFATADYDYDGRFGVSGMVRRDASYKFIADYKWGTFWSAGARWNINKESFMSGSSFNLLKLRGSYGTQGNANLSVATPGNNALYTGSQAVRDLNSSQSGYGGLSSIGVNVIANRDFRWEKISQANVGIDFDYKNSTITGSLDVYRKTTKDMFNNLNISATNGAYTLLGNLGDMRNQGIEALVRYSPFKGKDFNLTVFANGSYNQNRITRMPYTMPSLTNPSLNLNYYRPTTDVIHAEGHLAYEYFMVPYVGVNHENGNMLFLDKNGNLTENPTDDDRRFTGKSPIPKYQGGFGLETSYKGFYLDVLFTFAAKVWRVDADLQGLSNPQANLGAFPVTRDILDAWSPTNKNSDTPAIDASNYTQADDFSDRFLRDASYIRLRNIAVGYSVPKNVLGSSLVKSLKVFATAENMYTWTKWRGFDAESYATSTYGGYPTPKIISFGIEAEF